MTNIFHDQGVGSGQRKPTYLVTGATCGIGHAVATQLALRGCRVLVGARTLDSGNVAASRIRSRAPGAALDVVAADLSEMKQVRALVEQVRHRTSRLDGLILNAAEVRTRRELTSDGFEVNFATNYLSGFLLSHLLLPLLVRSGPARIVVLSSSNHSHIKHLDLDTLPTGKDFKHVQNYSTTKLLNVLFVAELARRLGGTEVTVNAADPGFARTNLGRHTTGFFRLFLTVMRPFQVTPEKAAATPVHLATSPKAAATTGGYFTKSRPGKPSPLSQDAASARELWDMSIELLTGKELASAEELV